MLIIEIQREKNNSADSTIVKKFPRNNYLQVSFFRPVKIKWKVHVNQTHRDFSVGFLSPPCMHAQHAACQLRALCTFSETTRGLEQTSLTNEQPAHLLDFNIPFFNVGDYNYLYWLDFYLNMKVDEIWEKRNLILRKVSGIAERRIAMHR